MDQQSEKWVRKNLMNKQQTQDIAGCDVVNV